MRDYSRRGFSDNGLLSHAAGIVARDCGSAADFVADLAEIDARKVYRQAGHSSLFALCVDGWHLSEDSAYKRIHAARAARRFPVLFEELDLNRLHLTAVRLLAPHLTSENVDELIQASVHKRSREIEAFLAQRFPGTRAVPPPTLRAIPTPSVELAAGQGDAPHAELAARQVDLPHAELAAGQVGPPQAELAAGQVEPRSRLFLLKTAIDEETHDDLRAIQDLLGHALPSGDLRVLIKRMARFYRAYLQKKRFGATRNAEASKHDARKREIPAHMRHAVWERDSGRCTFVGDAGPQCAARRCLEFDHVVPVARGGETTVENLRLRCHAHNQLEAERVFGARFMQEKRDQARAP